MYVMECTNAKACTIILRGASKDVLNEVDRNLRDATHVVRNIIQEPRLLPGGGAVEMALAQVSLGWRAIASLGGLEQSGTPIGLLMVIDLWTAFLDT